MFWHPDVFQHNLKRDFVVQEIIIIILLDSNKARIKSRGDNSQNIYGIKNHENILAPWKTWCHLSTFNKMFLAPIEAKTKELFTLQIEIFPLSLIKFNFFHVHYCLQNERLSSFLFSHEVV